MSRLCAQLVAWGCVAGGVLAGGLAVFFLIDIQAFAGQARGHFALPIQWATVTTAQWYGLWALTALHLGVGLAGLFVLRRAFVSFAQGAYFTPHNSRDLRLFAILLFVEALTKPLHYAFSSVLLSLNHPPGEKLLSISLASTDMRALVVALIFWVVSELLVKGSELQHENRQFI